MNKQDLIFDKLAVTIPLSEFNSERTFNRLVHEKIYQHYNGRVYGNNDGGYKNNYRLDIHEKNSVLVSIYPIDPNNNFFRIEYNPNKLGREGRILLRKCLQNILGKQVVRKIYFHATVTRLDLTLDVRDMVPDLYILIDRARNSEIYRDINGKILTQKLGSDRSDCRITMYDKNAELNNADTNNYQRIEIRLRNLQCTMHELNADLLRHFNKIQFYNAGFLADDRFDKQFVVDANLNGLNFALSKCSRNARLCYRRYLETYREFPINVDELDFEATRRRALKNLIHIPYRDEFLGNAA